MNAARIDEYIRAGSKDRDWYAECTALFLDLFGAERLTLVTNLFAATSINTSLKANITLFRRALYEIENGKPVGRYLPNIRRQLEQVRAGKELTGQKIRAFARAMRGETDAVVVDTWLLRAFDMDRKYYRKPRPGKLRGLVRSGGATEADFELIEFYCREKAELIGALPCQVSAMIWSGCRITRGGDRETHYKNLLRHSFTNLFGVI